MSTSLSEITYLKKKKEQKKKKKAHIIENSLACTKMHQSLLRTKRCIYLSMSVISIWFQNGRLHCSRNNEVAGSHVKCLVTPLKQRPHFILPMRLTYNYPHHFPKQSLTFHLGLLSKVKSCCGIRNMHFLCMLKDSPNIFPSVTGRFNPTPQGKMLDTKPRVD